ncbi:MAG: hypothetical protein PSX36_03045 [bacterium]|nr:hypothetical protein [bacterium]
MKSIEAQIQFVGTELNKHSVHTSYSNQLLSFSNHANLFTVYLVSEETFPSDIQDQAMLPLDLLMTAPEKIVSIVRSKLKLNRVIFARNCALKKVTKSEAENFLNRYHLMNATSSAGNYGLYYKEELLALASFSKGRKMNRLLEHERSYELIRFCSKTGITVAGGLTKLLKHFVIEKQAGDVMTYVDKQLSDGSSFIRSGFKKHSDLPPSHFLVNRKTFERYPVKDPSAPFDTKTYYLGSTAGNIKFIFSLH